MRQEMKRWLLRFGGAAGGTGFLWAGMWAGVAALIKLADPAGSMNAVWMGPPIGVHPGFVGGVAFFALLGIAARGRRIAELPLSVVIGCGAVVGLMLGVLPFAINKPPTGNPLWLVAGVVIGALTFLSAVSAAGMLAIARRMDGHALDYSATPERFR